LAQATKTAFYEDVEIIEAQQERINSARIDKPIIDINADAGVLRARRMLERLLDSQGMN
jgi:phenylpropionate dioxygenase-like ring-hydroxylating dioxygenase large terminal subunit